MCGKKLIWGGIILMSLLIFGSLNNLKSQFEFQSNIKKVNGISINADFSNIKVTSNHSDLSIGYQGEKSIFGEPNIDITYSNNKAIINVVKFKKGWKKFLPVKISRGNIAINIPPRFLEELHLETNNGNIDVNEIAEISQLSLIADVGTIRLNSFQGGLLNVKAGNGSIHLGEVDGQINIYNKVGSIKILDIKNVKGENKIKISNGNVKVKLPNETNNIGLNISTKNGNIKSNENKLAIIKKGPGKAIIHEAPNSDTKINISVSVGTIEIE